MQLAAASMMFPCRHLHLQQHCCQRVPQDCGAMATDSDKKHFQQTCSCEWHSWLAVSPKHRWTQTCNMCSLYVAMTIRWKPICVRQTKRSSLATSSYSWLRHTSHLRSRTCKPRRSTKNMLAKHVTFQVDHCEHLFQTNEVWCFQKHDHK